MILVSFPRRSFEIICLAVAVSTVLGCALGRSWDNHTTSSDGNCFPDKGATIFYLDEGDVLVAQAFGNVSVQRMPGELVLKKAVRGGSRQYPLLSFAIEVPKWNDNPLFNASYVISAATFSLLPGYSNKISRVTLKFVMSERPGDTCTKRFTLVVKRHYVSWLPFFVMRNFFQTVQVWSEPELDWLRIYENMIRDFANWRALSMVQSNVPARSITDNAH